MRAIIFSTELNDTFQGLEQHLPSALVPLVDRPIVQHIVEMLADQEVTEFEFFISHLPEEVEAFLGNGERWGCHFRYHVVSDESEFYQSLIRLELLPEEKLIIGHTDSLPVNGTIKTIHEGPEREFLISSEKAQGDSKQLHWTGWAVASSEIVSNLFHCRTRDEVLNTLLEHRVETVELSTDSIVHLGSPYALLEAQEKLLSQTPEDLVLAGREIKPNIRYGRQTRVHSSAKIEGPAFLGENVQIGKNVVIGPNSVIGKNCVLDDGCSVHNSVIIPHTYVGRDIDLKNSVACRRFLVSPQHETGLEIEDSFILGDLQKRSVKGRRNTLVSRASAALALFFFSPIMLLAALSLKIFRTGPVLHRWNAVTRRNTGNRILEFDRFSFLPAKRVHHYRGIKLILLDLLPGLVNVFRGEMALVGPRPKSLSELDLVPPSWRDLYLESRPGIISEAQLILGPDADGEEIYAVEAFYSVTQNGLGDIRLVIEFIRRSLLGRRRILTS
jgi:NDP-sugar pyrophosphorylase family protein